VNVLVEWNEPPGARRIALEKQCAKLIRWNRREGYIWWPGSVLVVILVALRVWESLLDEGHAAGVLLSKLLVSVVGRHH
jgi:hypothetical protein